MDPILQKLLLLGMDLAVVGLNKAEVKSLTDDLAAQGRSDEEISAILDDLSMAESKDIRDTLRRVSVVNEQVVTTENCML